MLRKESVSSQAFLPVRFDTLSDFSVHWLEHSLETSAKVYFEWLLENRFSIHFNVVSNQKLVGGTA